MLAKTLEHLYDRIDNDTTSIKACLLTLCLYPDRAVVSEAIGLLMQFAEGTKKIIRVAKLTHLVDVKGQDQSFKRVSERASFIYSFICINIFSQFRIFYA